MGNFCIVNEEPTALRIQCDSKAEFVLQRGTKGLHKKMETVMAGCSVQVQCTNQSLDSRCSIAGYQERHACSLNLHTFVFPQLQNLFFVLFCLFWDRVHCTLCEEKEDEPNSGVATTRVQDCKDIMQKCIHLTGIYSMLSTKTGWEVHNDIQPILEKRTKKRGGAQTFTQCYSNLTEEKKDKKKRCSHLRVSKI